MKRITIAVLLGTAVLSFTSVASYGQQQSFVASKSQGYLVDRNGNIVKSARTGHCVQLGRQWAPNLADKECAATQAAQSRK